MVALDSPRTGKVAGAIVAALILLVGLTWVVFTSVYSPIRPNGFGGVRGAMKALDDDSGWPRHEWTGRPWTRWGLAGPANGSGELLIGLRNDGPLPIRLLGDGYEDDVERSLITVRWAADMSMGGGFPEARPFPVTLQPGDQFTLVIKVTKRGCYYDNGGAGGSIIGAVPLRWSLLGRERTHLLDADMPDTGMEEIVVCPLPSAIEGA